jgi:hypothetical protein
MPSEPWGDLWWRETGASLPWREVVAETPDYLVMLTEFVAYRAGLTFTVDARVTHRSVLLDVLGFGLDTLRDMRLTESGVEPPASGLVIAARDGATRPAQGSRSASEEIALEWQSGQGDELSWEEQWWLSPLPTADTLELDLSWPFGELPNGTLTFDARELRTAAARSRIWHEETN